KITYNTWDSLVVTDPTTSQAIGSLSMGERTGSRVFYHLWSYVIIVVGRSTYKRGSCVLGKPSGKVPPTRCEVRNISSHDSA
ncbi:hypothetical protein NEUTE1DRAFT_39410, partial [Neurospora tetrasperma FGSC 2508]